MNVFIAGAGTMGAGIAQVFLTGGWSVTLYDINAGYVEKGLTALRNALERQQEKGKLTLAQKEAALAAVKGSTDLGDAANCALAIEAVTERVEVKISLFSSLNAICPPETVFATNTSSLSITEIASGSGRPDRVAGMHFFNPAPVMKLVEVIRGAQTSDETMAFVSGTATAVGKEPVTVNEAPGFVVNRLLIPMLNEAVQVLAEGIASAEDIDKAMKLGAGHPMGPLALADMIGNDVNLAIMEQLYEETGDPKYRPHPQLKKMVRAGHLGRKTKKGFFEY